MAIRGTAADDHLTGTSGNDEFDLWQGGNDTVDGGGGNDLFRMGAALNAGDKIDGGAGHDEMILNGDYSAGLVFNADTITNIEVLNLSGGHSYNLTLNDGNIATGASLLVKAGSLGSGDSLTLNDSAETDGQLYVVAGAGDDTITGGAQNDVFHMEMGGTDTVHGGGGNDTFYLGQELWTSDQIDGGAGFDRVLVTGFGGGDTITFASTTVLGVEDFILDTTTALGITTDDATVAAGATMTFDASKVANGFFFDGSAETDGQFIVIGGAGDDTLTGGANGDAFHLEKGGNDTASGGGGNDHFFLGAKFNAADQIDGGAGFDTVTLNGGAAVFFDATTMTGVERLLLSAGHSYSLRTDEATVAAGQTLTIDASALDASHRLGFQGFLEHDGYFNIIGGAGDDLITGGALADTFHLEKGGNDTVNGGGGNDTFYMGATFNAADKIIGGAGSDTVVLDGMGDDSLTFTATMMTGVEKLVLNPGHFYTLTTDDATVAAGAMLTVDGSHLGASDPLIFDGSAETDGTFTILAGAGNDILTGGANADNFHLEKGGIDIVNGGAGDDHIFMGASLTALDQIDGGDGYDIVILNGGAAVTFNATTMTNVEQIDLIAGHSYSLTTNDATVAAGEFLTVDATTLGAGNALTFDGSAETDGSFIIGGGAGNDVITGGQWGDEIDLSFGGNDTVTLGAGFNQVYMGAALTAADHIDGSAGIFDQVILDGDYSGAHALVFGATTLVDVDDVLLAPGNSYDLTSNDANVSAGGGMQVDGSYLGPTDSLHFDGSAETDGSLFLIDGQGNDVLIGGGGNDLLAFDQGGTDSGTGGAGDDFIDACGHFDTSDHFDGGTGTDTIELTATETDIGSYTGVDALAITASMMSNIEVMQLDGGSYDITTADGVVAAGSSLTVDGTDLSNFYGDTLNFDGSAETDGSFTFVVDEGAYSLTGGAQDDLFQVNGHFSHLDSIDGGGSTSPDGNTIEFDGNYSSFTFDATSFQNIQTLRFDSGHDYHFTLDDGNVASGATLNVDGSGLGASDQFSFDASADTDAIFNFYDGAGDDALFGGQGTNYFFMTGGGNDYIETALSPTSQNYIYMYGNLTASDTIAGNIGYDQVDLSGDYTGANAVVFSATTMTGVDKLFLEGGHSYDLTTNDATVDSAVNPDLTVDSTGLGSSDTLTFDGSAELDANFIFNTGHEVDTLTGGDFGDTFNMGAFLTAADTIDGGGGFDTVSLDGNYTGVHALVLGATTLTNVENLVLADGNSYDITTNDATVAGGATLDVDASVLSAAFGLTFDGSAETDGSFTITGSAGVDTLTGGAQTDAFYMGANLTAADTIDGGGGDDSVYLDGDYSGVHALVLGATTLTNVENIVLTDGNSYDITTDDATVASGETLTVGASALSAAYSLTFDGSAETDGSFTIFGSAGVDTLTGGVGDDTFNMGANLTAADTIDGGDGIDTVNLDGDYTGPNAIVFTATTLTNVENLVLAGGHSYDITTDDATVVNETRATPGGDFTIDGSALGAGDVLTVDASAETGASSFTIIGGAGDDVITGPTGATNAHNVVFDLSHGGDDTVTTGTVGGTFLMGGALTAADQLDGFSPSSESTVVLDGDYSSGLVLADTTIANMQTIQFTAGHSYNLTTADGNVAANETLFIEGSALGAGDSLTFDGSAETDGGFYIVGGAGNDVLTGGSGLDGATQLFTGLAESNYFDLWAGGEDTAHGASGNDTFNMVTAFDSGDAIDGGGGTDVVILNGNYTGANAVVFGATTMQNVEYLQLYSSNSYDLTTNDATVAAGATLTVDASSLSATDSLTFDGSAETNGSFAFLAGFGDDVLTGGAKADLFDLTLGGNDTAHGGGGNDTFNLGAQFGAGDSIDGGAGNDTVNLNGDYTGGAALVFTPTTLTNVEKLVLADGNSYDITTDDATVANNGTLTVDASALSATYALTFDGSAETNGGFQITDGAGNDVLTGGAQGDEFFLKSGGSDTVHGGGGDDIVFAYGMLDASDTIDGGAGTDNELHLFGADYTGAHALVMGATTVTNFELITFGAGFSYDITTNDATVAAGQTLNVNDLTDPGDTVTFDGAAETDGHFSFLGGPSADNFTGGAQADIFHMENGGVAALKGGGGDDLFEMGQHFDASDSIDGGAGTDTVNLDGDYSGGLSITSTMMTNVETLSFGAFHSYNITLADDGVVASGQTLTVDASALISTHALTFDGSAETDGSFDITGGAGDDTLTGGAQADTFDLTKGGADTAHGGAGDDTFLVKAAFVGGDTIDGGTGTNTITVVDDLSASLSDASISNIETVTFAAGFSYDATVTGDITSGAGTLTLDGSALGASDALTLDLSGATTTAFAVTGGAGDDSVSMSLGAIIDGSTFDGGTGNDTLELTSGDDIVFSASTMTNVETLKLDDGSSYGLTLDDANVAAGATLNVDASALTGTNDLIFIGTAETDGFFAITGGAGDDTVILGSGFSASADSFDGGAGTDSLELTNVSGTFAFTDTTIANVENLFVNASGNISITTTDANVAAGETLTVDFSSTNVAGATLVFDGSAETDGQFEFFAPAAASSVNFTGGALSDSLTMGNDGTPGNSFNGLGGDDTLTMTAASSATVFEGGTGNDTLAMTGGGTIFGGALFALDSVENLALDNNTWNVTMLNGAFLSPETLNVDATALTGGHTLTFNGSPTADGTYVFEFAGNFTAGDALNGGPQDDTLSLDGDYSAGITFGASTITNIENILLADGFSYNLTSNDGNIAAGQTLLVNGAALSAAYTLTFDGSAETNGSFDLIGGAGDDVLTGGAGNDGFNLTQGGDDTAHGGVGNDTFSFGDAFTAADTVDGGANSDTVSLNGDYSAGLVLGATTITSIENIVVQDGHSYNITTVDQNVASGATLTLIATSLTGPNALTFDGSAETDGHFHFLAGAGDDDLVGGAQSDTFDLTHGGNDAAFGNGGNDLFIMGTTFDASDDINGGSGTDTLEIGGSFAVTTILNVTDANVSGMEVLQLDQSTNLQEVDVTGDITSGGGTLSIVSTATTGFDYTNVSAATTPLIDFTGGAADNYIKFGANFDVADQIDGGGQISGNALDLAGEYFGGTALVFNASTIQNIQQIDVDGSFDYDITLNAANVTGTNSIGVFMLGTTELGTLIVDASAFTTQGLTASGGDAADTLTGGGGINDLQGGLGDDILNSANGSDSEINGGMGQDTITVNSATTQNFFFQSVAESTSSTYDIVTGMNFDNASFSISGFWNAPIGAIDTAVTTGTLDTGASFDGDLETAIGSGQLGANDAVLFTADSSSTGLAGSTFLIVDINGIAGYQAGQDLVIDLGTSYAGTLHAGNFI
jgi:Ca2+-binding RTX toxin-like protein